MLANAYFWDISKHATSYSDTAWGLFELFRDAVSGLPAYTVPEVPFGLKTEPEAFTALPGKTGMPWHVVPLKAPGYPGLPVGLGAASAVPVGTNTASTKTAIDSRASRFIGKFSPGFGTRGSCQFPPGHARIPARADAPQPSTSTLSPLSIIFQLPSECARASSDSLLSWVRRTRVPLPSDASRTVTTW